jgi:hypothetical protein
MVEKQVEPLIDALHESAEEHEELSRAFADADPHVLQQALVSLLGVRRRMLTELADELEHEMSIIEQRHVAALAWAGADLYIASLQALLGHYRAMRYKPGEVQT